MTHSENPMDRLMGAGRTRAKQILQLYKNGSYLSDDMAALAITQAIILAMQNEEAVIDAEREASDNGEAHVEH
jgi:hypothetical protein